MHSCEAWSDLQVTLMLLVFLLSLADLQVPLILLLFLLLSDLQVPQNAFQVVC